MKQRMKQLLKWLKAHVRPIKVEKDSKADVKGGAVGFHFWF